MRPVRALLITAAALLPASYLAFAGPKSALAVTHVFELNMEGKSWQTDVIINPGVKPPIGKVTNKKIAETLKGELPDFAADYLNLDPGGKFYLLYDGKSSWRVATNPDGINATTLTGQVANDGQFWMGGAYNSFMADATVFLAGKVKFEKGTNDPKKVSGKFYFVSEAIGTGLNLTFKTTKKVQ